MGKYVIDLFCGEGGASKGYANAGFTVVGVDNNAKRLSRYPYSAYLGEWDTGLLYWMERINFKDIAFIHASPPCQYYSEASAMARARGVKVDYPDLIPPVRKALAVLYAGPGLDYVIENVPQAPLKNPVTLCGSFFGLQSRWKSDIVSLKRHRAFESTFPVSTQEFVHSCQVYRNVPVYGHGAPGYREGDPYFTGRGFAVLTREVMGIEWMSRRGLTEAIPPKYAEHVATSWKTERKDK